MCTQGSHLANTLTMTQDHRRLPGNSIAIIVICITIR